MREYLGSGFSGDKLLHEMGNTILKDDTGNFILSTLRTILEEWENPLIADHPSRTQLLIGRPASRPTSVDAKETNRPPPPHSDLPAVRTTRQKKPSLIDAKFTNAADHVR